MHDFDRYPFQFDWFSNPVEKILLTIYNVPWLIQPKNFQKEHYLVNAQGAQTGGYFLATWSERIPQTVEKCSNDVKAKDHCQRGKCQKRQTGLDHVQGLFSWKKGLCIILFLWSTHSCNHEHFAYRRFSCDHLYMPKRLTSHKAAAIITQYVRDNCDCLPLTAFEKWKDGVKQSLNKESRVNLLEWNSI